MLKLHVRARFCEEHGAGRKIGPLIATAIAALCFSVLAQSAMAQTAAAQSVPAAAPVAAQAAILVTAANVDTILRPGDFLFKYLDTSNKSGDFLARNFQRLINLGQRAYTAGTKEWNDLIARENLNFKKGLEKGDPNAIHMAVYIGGGWLAEANGTTLKNAAVNRWNLFTAHKGESWRVFRLKNRQVAADVAVVAGNWANARMKYLLPAQASVSNSWFGPKAKANAILYSEAFSTVGGPPSVSRMFCSQFSVAVAQSAAIKSYLAPQGKLTTDALEALPKEYKFDASSSPVTVYGIWEGSNAFDISGPIVVE